MVWLSPASSRTCLGRFDQAGKVLGDAVNPEEYEDVFKEIYKKLSGGDVQGGTAELMDLARKIQVLQNPHDISKQVLGMQVAGQAWNEVWINGLLSAPLTFTTNAFSAAYAVARPMITYGAAKSMALTGNKLAEQVAAESAAAVTEIFHGVQRCPEPGCAGLHHREPALQQGSRPEHHGQYGQRAAGTGRQVSPC